LVWDLRLQIRINADRFERYREEVRKHEECHCVDARRARALVIPLVEKRLRDLFDAESKAVAGSGKQNWKQNAETKIRAQLQSVSDSYKGVFCSVWGATAKEWDSKNGINKANWDGCGRSKVSFGS
jgi:hypothetical protein